MKGQNKKTIFSYYSNNLSRSHGNRIAVAMVSYAYVCLNFHFKHKVLSLSFHNCAKTSLTTSRARSMSPTKSNAKYHRSV